METWVNSRVVYDGKLVKLRAGEVRIDDGRLALREVVEHPGGVCVIPYTGHSVLFVRQYRIALGQYILEAPAGKLEKGDTPESRGAAEVEEETGYRAGKLVEAGRIFSTVGYCNEIIYLYLGLDLMKTAQRLDEDERIEVVEMPIGEVYSALREHRFEDSKTAVGLYALFDYLESNAGVA